VGDLQSIFPTVLGVQTRFLQGGSN
jgi:hypothetical protein